MLNILIILFLIFVLIINIYRLKDKFQYRYTQLKEKIGLLKIEINLRDFTRINNLKILAKLVFEKFFIINSWKKFNFIISVFLIFILINFRLNDLLRFILIEIILIIIALAFLGFLKKEGRFEKVIIGQLYIPLIEIVIAIKFFLIDLEHQNISLPIFYITMTILILSLYISISLYYSEKSSKFKLWHLLCCYLNIGFVCVIMFTYIGYGFMIYESKNLNLKANEGVLNINGSENVLNTFAILISYGLDNLSQGSGIELSKTHETKDINTNEIVFSLVCKIFISTYLALVLAFLSNTLFNKVDNRK
ncbi:MULTISPECIES: hypothetical protein [Mammaliicoccus]|nr:MULTISPECIES: hypothetical protein [Mammaliicoccus]MCD8895345.1 hypothetical protein [Mammaliicoccus sciuri]MCD8913511.1 hypothetical protein [Mammaliicoccus sciuri]MCJ0920596.1 hypothetical protein [Mammaliicoccus sciuri]MCJ0958396.1 hypothetical protein [Mammaliicoccus sciuri]MCJ0963407.1 hypothetical protein [Mammaliicoccus sciuri]